MRRRGDESWIPSGQTAGRPRAARWTLALAVGLLAAGRLEAAKPRKSLAEEDAVVLQEQLVVEILDATRLTLKVHQVIEIHNEQGSGKYGGVALPESGFQQCVDFKGLILDNRGRQVKKLKKGDLIRQYGTDDFSADYREEWSLCSWMRWGFYPHTIQLDYQLEISTLLFWPVWEPLWDIPVLSASYTLTADPAVGFHTYCEGFNPDTTMVVSPDGRTRTWTLANLAPRLDEPNMPVECRRQLCLWFAPERFSVDRSTGSLASWSDLAVWAGGLATGRDKLPPAVAEEVRRLFKPEDDARTRIDKLYAFLQLNTRYVAIEVGIGGWQPHDASSVHERKYGDCKDLAHYMIALLKVAGIPACPALVRTRDAGAIVDSFPSSQFNHVICLVPLESDTLWLDCTASHMAVGELPAGDEGRQVLVVGERGGALVRTPRSMATDNGRLGRLAVAVSTDGQARLTGRLLRRGNMADGIREWLMPLDEKERVEGLEELLAWRIPSFQLEHHVLQNLDGHYDLPVAVEFAGTAPHFATVNGGRLMLNPNLLSRLDRAAVPDAERTFPYELEWAYLQEDSVTVEVPAGFRLEAAPGPQELLATFGSYLTDYQVDGQVLRYWRRLRVDRDQVPLAEFPAYRAFVQAVSKNDEAQFVFVR